jgi:8-oxo-dGTP pyrophosphatase MutT (NUDIX family)
MAKRAFWKHLAGFLRSNPWVMVGARSVWQLTRPRFSVGAVGVVLNAEQHVLMVEHVFHPYVPWGLPGGWIERNENPSVGVARELQEELSLSVAVGPIIAADMVGNSHLDLAYLCTPHSEVGKLSFELLQYKWYPPSDLPKTHSFHRLAITNALQHPFVALQDNVP